MENIVIGVEGLVGSGKTSICRELLNKIPNSIIFHGGNLYRGIVYALMNNKNIKNIDALKNNIQDVDIKEVMDTLNVEIKIEDRQTVIYINGNKIDEESLQSDNTSLAVSVAGNAANNENLFIFARNLINKFKEKYNVIVSGRALMEIYPNLDYHFFITASLEERVNRKMHQYNNKIDKTELEKHIKQRDEIQEKSGFYKIYDNTIKIDVTNCKTAAESSKKILEHIKEIY